MGTAFFLFVIGFAGIAAGILIGRYYVPDDRTLRRTARHSEAYVRALNRVLARDIDGAIDELKRAVKEDVSDVEPYFALGALFRSRGEWERAIRVHQAVGMRSDADRALVLRARYELGLDFRAAGMPRRATRAMEECVADDDRHEGALRALGSLYEEQGRYAEAAAAWRRLDPASEGGPREQHLLAAAAQVAVERMDLDEARRLLREAERRGGDHPHVQLAASVLATAEDDPATAAARLADAIAAAPELSSFLVPLLYDAEQAAVERSGSLAPSEPPESAESPESRDAESGDPDSRAAERTAAVLEEIVSRIGREPHLLLALAEIRSHFAPEKALEDYRAVADEHRELLPARIASARLALAAADAGEIQSELRAMVDSEGALGWATGGTWRCEKCGHRDDRFFWRCARCRRWGEVRRDLGRAAQDPEPPRDRRADIRPLALPAPSIDIGMLAPRSDEDPGDETLLSRASGALSGVWRTIRSGRRPPGA